MPDTAAKVWQMALIRFWAPVPWMLELAVVVELVVGDLIQAAVIAALLVFNGILGFLQDRCHDHRVAGHGRHCHDGVAGAGGVGRIRRSRGVRLPPRHGQGGPVRPPSHRLTGHYRRFRARRRDATLPRKALARPVAERRRGEKARNREIRFDRPQPRSTDAASSCCPRWPSAASGFYTRRKPRIELHHRWPVTDRRLVVSSDQMDRREECVEDERKPITRRQCLVCVESPLRVGVIADIEIMDR